MPSDPRLLSVELLTLAAYSVQQRRQRHVPTWRYTVGISSLLEAARALPQRDPWDLPAVDAGGSMGRLLAEARQWEKEHERGT